MKIKNLKTGYVFDMPEEDALAFVEKDRLIFKIVDDNYVEPQKQEVKTTMFESVVQDNPIETKHIEFKPTNPDVDDFVDSVLDEGLENMGRQELRDYCKRNNIKYSVTWSKDKLLETIKG